MVVLTTHVGEEIVIDGNIRVMVTAVQGSSAPPAVAVDRKEVHDLESEMVAVGNECNGLEEPFFWPPVDLGGSD